ncbi:hypothetical protein GCM10011533_31080 [Streptosporangium jomthongense]|uniref:Uncharacterized protein n=1 Tax=Marinobacter aromaticivorans TaxID=1494078 RepID=A0ABW2IYH5_9GAMM|nr:hypothetical protein [Marinobacter aromaticivorans]GGE76458.1 hypothetical protein GCM10011533_31080 [Streptosporangium jomthongense]
MGPVALFDKSFLQSLSVDESVWFDHFFVANISPLFYIETLADLDKEMSRGKTAEQVVGNIAEKAPQMSGAANISHLDLLVGSLMGYPVSMTNRPVIGGGRQVEAAGKRGVNFDLSPEAKAFNRWQDGEYQKLEREFARAWRAQIKGMTFESSASYAQKLGVDISSCKNMNDAANAANRIVNLTNKPYELIGFIVNAVGIPREYQQKLVRRYQIAGFPPLTRFAPYAAHVIKVEVFFHICVSRGFISADRPSNKIDIAYLHYLPFCNVFISGDKLHRSTVDLFLKDDQRFVWGPDLKMDLGRLNAHYMEFPQEVKDKGVLSFASRPPTEVDYLTSELWDLLGPSWRNSEGDTAPITQETNDKILEHVKQFTDAPTLPPDGIVDPLDEVDSVSLQRSVRRKRGSWYQVPKDLKDG